MPPTTVPLPEPSQLRRKSSKLAKGYVRIRLGQSSGDRGKLALLQHSASFLEMARVIAAVWEAARELGIQTWDDRRARGSEWAELAEACAGVSFKEFVEEHAALLLRAPRRLPAVEMMEILNLMRKAADWAVTACPIEDLLRIADELGQHELGDRCRRAYAQVRAILFRTKQTHKFAIAGRAYVEGRLSVEEIAEFLDVPVWDALAQLDTYSWVRPTDTIRLSEKGRADILERVRADRISRDGEPVVDVGLITRDVIASQRIEGIDARPWLAK